MKKLAWLALLILSALAPDRSFAEDAPDCARCHQNPALEPTLKNAVGVPRSLYIDPEAFQASWHYRLGDKTKCVSCHKGITRFPHQREQPLRCSDCHPVEKKPMFIAIEARVGESVHRELDCNDCHDVHKNKPAAAMTLTEKNQGCLNCHQYGRRPSSRSALNPIPIAEYHSWHPEARLHLERMACIVCHTDLETGDADKHLIQDKSHATRRCATCHRGSSKVAEYLIDVGPGEKEGVTATQMLSRIYLVGGTRNKWIEF